MLYVIVLLVIVLIIALVLKQRSTTNENAAKTTAKKAATAKKTSKTKLVENPISTQKQATSLTPELRHRIEGLIQKQNYFSAEAQINQALNRDNTQHELYLLLLDIHILQKDEFAVNQLINHIKSLNLDSIIPQAELRKTEFTSSLHQLKDSIDYPSAESKSSAVESKSASVAPETTTLETEHTQVFDQLQNQTNPKTADPVVGTKPFEFSLQSTTKIPAGGSNTYSDIATDRTLDLNTESSATSDSTQLETACFLSEEKSEQFANFSLESMIQSTENINEVTTTAAVVPEDIQPLDLNFSKITATSETEIPVHAEPVTTDEIQALDFSFSTLDETAHQAPSLLPEIPATLDLDFNFNIAEPIKPAVEKPVEPLDFQTELNLDFNLLDTSTSESNREQLHAENAIELDDPLLKAFPEIAQQDEVLLNFELAEQYIQLGAFDAARELLLEKEAQYTASQQKQAAELRNQIA